MNASNKSYALPIALVIVVLGILAYAIITLVEFYEAREQSRVLDLRASKQLTAILAIRGKTQDQLMQLDSYVSSPSPEKLAALAKRVPIERHGVDSLIREATAIGFEGVRSEELFKGFASATDAVWKKLEVKTDSILAGQKVASDTEARDFLEAQRDMNARLLLVLQSQVDRQVERDLEGQSAFATFDRTLILQLFIFLVLLVVAGIFFIRRLNQTHMVWSKEGKELFAIFEGMVDGVLALDPQGRIVRANRAAERILEAPVSEITKRTFVDPRWRAVDRNGEALSWEKFEAALKDKGRITNMEYRLKLPDGRTKNLVLNASSFTYLPDFRKGIAVAFREISPS